MTSLELLKQTFGHAAFRGGQQELVEAILKGRDAFGIMPTGGGKSVCYQLPALMLPGITLVISPLISLMKDQVMALQSAGVAAAFLNSSLRIEEMREVYEDLRAGLYKIIYIAPERLDGEGFTALAQSLPISLVAVDEAHCISQWGQDFRPSYLRIVEFLNRLPVRPTVAAFTATATAQVKEDVTRILQLRAPHCVTTGFDRPNLNFEVLRPQNRTATLQMLISERKGKCGVIYCATRKTVEKLCDALRESGVPATRYHAGLPDDERRQNQEDFLYDRAPVMVATNAFGMGIDKSNVSFVIHYNMPRSMEAYYQEAGRAGRDGEAADCFLLYAPADIQTAKFFIENASENDELTEEDRASVRMRDYERLNTMVSYCKTTACLRGIILDYFGQPHAEKCANCSNCRTSFTVQDITTPAQMILSCVKRIKDKLGYAVGATMVVNVLCASTEQRVVALGLQELSTYGLLRQTPRAQVKEYLEHLIANAYLVTDSAHGGVLLTAKAADVLFRGVGVEMAVRETRAAEKRRSKSRTAQNPVEETGLFAALKALRFRLAQEEGVPAYIIFTNATLADMAEKAPQTLPQFLEVSGVGQSKAERYGAVFLREIAAYEAGT